MTDVTSVCIFPPIGEHMTVAGLQCEVKGEVAFFFLLIHGILIDFGLMFH